MHSTAFSRARVLTVGKIALCFSAITVLGACAHPIGIEASTYPERPSTPISSKTVAYVMTDSDRQRQVTTEGGGGDKVTYYPYKDFERSLRAALSTVYADVSVARSGTDAAHLRELGVTYVFLPELVTTSSSPSAFTWPPTRFSVTVTLDVLDQTGAPIGRLRATGQGEAEYEEFKSNFGLAGRRAVEDAARVLSEELRRAERLH